MICFNINTVEVDNTKTIANKMKQQLKENHLKAWIDKPQHGYLMRTRKSVDGCKEDLTNTWLKKSVFSSHVEGYICAIQEEEIFTNAIKTKRMKQNDNMAYCRLCKQSKELFNTLLQPVHD